MLVDLVCSTISLISSPILILNVDDNRSEDSLSANIMFTEDGGYKKEARIVGTDTLLFKLLLCLLTFNPQIS